MNTFEITFLSLNFVLTIAGLEYCIRHFAIRNREVDKTIKTLKDRIFELESMLRYDIKFELSELKNKQELIEVKISKASFDFEEFKFHILTQKQAETLAKSILKSMSDKKVEQEETKPSESVQNEVVDLIKDDSITIDEVTQQTEMNFQEKPKRKPRKKEVKTNITPHQIEESFIERYGMTYYGYRKIYGDKKFLKAKNNAYMRVYYKQITKNEKK